MQATRLPVRDLRDIVRLEAQPLPLRPHSSYEALLEAALRFPGKTALRFFIDGYCHDPARIPWRARLRAAAAWLRYGQAVARPYETYSFAELAAWVSRTARVLRAQGIGRDDVVTLLLPNLPETLVCHWASETVGIVNPINPLLEPDIIRSIMENAGSRLLITMGELPGSDIWAKVARIREQLPALRCIIVARGKVPAGCLSLRDACKRHGDQPLPAAEWPTPDQVASLFHTGGTTGLPKLVRGTHRNKVANARMLVSVSPLSSEDNGLIALPLFHVNAAINALIGLQLGMCTVLAGPAGFRTPGVRDNFFKILASQRISYFSAVPSILASLLQVPTQGADLSGVRFAISAASALPVEVMKAFTDKTGIRILEGYGQTEATVASCLNPHDGECRPGSVGLRLPHTRVQTALLGEAGSYQRACRTNEIGHLLIAGEHVSAGYLSERHDQTLWVLDPRGQRWLNSGDLARIDEQGYVWLTGRAKELIIRGGHNIDPRMIEDALQAHPAVLMAAAVARPDPLLGEMPVAYVMLRAGMTVSAEQLSAYAQQHIPERAAWPKAVHLVDELPLTAIGKVFKPRLVQLEQEASFSGALGPMRGRVAALQVRVFAHHEYGHEAEIRTTLNTPDDAELVSRQVAQLMMPFATRYRLVIENADGFGEDAPARRESADSLTV